jgi:glycosyltransferase involved in cell wall biosynthesis
MQLIRIFSFPSHSPGKQVSGVDYPRVIQPMKFLDGYKDEDTMFEVVHWDGKKIAIQEWDEITKGIDILFFNYTIDDWAFASMGEMCRKNNVKMVMDIDDAVWRINPDNTVYDKYKKGSKGIAILTDICNEVDYLTCTNTYLKNVLVDSTTKKHEEIACFGNNVDLGLYNATPDLKDSYSVNIVHYGSSSHYSDLKDPEFQKGMDKIMYDYPNVTFLTVGSFFGELKEKWGKRYEEEFGALNFLDWAKNRFPEVMAKTDIFVAPLTDNVYNRCKSDIKRSEVATAKKPFVGQDIRQYQECITNGVDGFLCRTADNWYETIKKLIDDKELRKSIGQAGYDRVLKTRQAKDMVKDYADFFKKVLTK